MNIKKLKTLGDLKEAKYISKSIKDELRDNLIEKLRKKEVTFEGVYGYENTVIPELERAILSRHNINLLGLRGQAKTRLARLMLNLLDEYIPIVKGSEINDDPLRPLSRYAIDLINDNQDETPIKWLHRNDRFYEKFEIRTSGLPPCPARTGRLHRSGAIAALRGRACPRSRGVSRSCRQRPGAAQVGHRRHGR